MTALGRMWLLLAIFASSVVSINCALATMSIDLGSQSIEIGLVKPGVPMEIVINKESRRKTPFAIGLRNGERFFGDSALQMSVKHPANTFTFFLDLIGKQFDNPIVKRYQEQFPHLKLVPDEARGTVVFDTADGEYSVESLLAMVLWNAKEQTEAFAGQPVKNAVITIPAFFNQAERKAVAAAAEIAGLNLLQLLTDGSAAGLNYGVFRRKEIKEQTQTLLIYDIGATKTQATIVEYRLAKEKNSKEMNPVMSTLGVGFNRTLGGNELTLRLRKHLVEQFNKQVKTEGDIAKNPRAMAKLTKEAERVKQVLSANVDHFAQVESLFEDKDFKVRVTREELMGMLKDLESFYLQPISDALRMADVNIDNIDLVALMGAGTRVPRIQQLLSEFVNGKELGRFLNTDEAIALGAVYQAAHLSTGFKVKKFDVQELQIYPVHVSFTSVSQEKEEKLVSRVIYGYKSYYPAAKKLISFTSHTDDFNFNITYGPLNHFSKEQIEQFGYQNISKIEVKDVGEKYKAEVHGDDAEFKGVKVHFQMDNFGVVKVDHAELIVEKVAPEKPSNSTLSAMIGKIGEFFSDSTKKDSEGQVELDSNKEEPAGSESDSGEKSETTTDVPPTSDEKKEKDETAEKKEGDESKQEEKKTEEAKPEKKEAKDEKSEKKADTKKEKKEVKPKILKTPLKLVAESSFRDLTSDDIKESNKILVDFEKKEKSKAERDAALNSLEAAVYDFSSKLEEEEFARFGTADELDAIRVNVTTLKTWLEDEVSLETTTDEIKAKKKELDSSVKKLKSRQRQKQERSKYVEGLEKALNESSSNAELFKSSGFFTDVELSTLTKVVDEIKRWFDVKKEDQSKLADNEDPAYTVAELKDKTGSIEQEVKYLFSKMYTSKMKAEQEKLQKLKEEMDKAAKEAAAKNDTASGEKPKEEGEAKASDSTDSAEDKKTEQETPKKVSGDDVNLFDSLEENIGDRKKNTEALTEPEAEEKSEKKSHDQSEL